MTGGVKAKRKYRGFIPSTFGVTLTYIKFSLYIKKFILTYTLFKIFITSFIIIKTLIFFFILIRIFYLVVTHSFIRILFQISNSSL